MSSAKRVAGSVGKAAAHEGATQLAELAQRHFGGSGTAEQGVKACAYSLASLRKIVTAFRRDQAKMPVNDFLMAQAHSTIVGPSLRAATAVCIDASCGSRGNTGVHIREGDVQLVSRGGLPDGHVIRLRALKGQVSQVLVEELTGREKVLSFPEGAIEGL